MKTLAKEKYNYSFAENEQISQFVSAFHDAVLLFANALNKSIEENGESALVKPLNGTLLTKLMWGSSFRGITGNVTIDKNGDRLSDYSLLDMNPNTSEFEIVANYFHNTGLTFAKGKKIHWAGGRTDAPADKPVCGFDNSLCTADDSSTLFAILSLILGLVVIVMTVVSFLSYRHYKIEAEISSMTWRVNWNEVIPVPTANQIRGSFHSRAGSQLVCLCLSHYEINFFLIQKYLKKSNIKKLKLLIMLFPLVCVFRGIDGRSADFYSNWMF